MTQLHEARTAVDGERRSWTTRCTCGWQSPHYLDAEESRGAWRRHALSRGDSA